MGELGDALRVLRGLGERGEPVLLLAPASDRGWFGGTGMLAWGGTIANSSSPADATAALEDAFEGRTGPCAALIGYEGETRVVRFGDAEPVPREALAAALGASQAPPALALLGDVTSDLGGVAFRGAVERVRERIARGDVYVLNLTRRIEGAPRLAPWDAFVTLLSRARSEMAALLLMPGGAVASASPERFVRVTAGPNGRRVEVCPIKGTRPRGADPASDAACARELLEDAKELAEHIMVVDLERNDIGRTCIPGTVQVEPLYEVVPTPYCHQLVSTVRGIMRAEATFAELLDATFPCGSVTGAPKLAAIRIAAELEASERGAYCGSLAVAVPGRLDSSVLIRTLEYRADGSAAWGTGCGITFDSDPAEEWLESELKASPAIGDGLPPVALRETCRIVGGRVPLMARHLARLVAGGCGPSVLARVAAEVADAVGSADAGATRLSVTVAASGEVVTETSEVPSTLAVPGGPTIASVQVREAPRLPPGAAKPADRASWDSALAGAREAGCDQAVLVTPDGRLVDGATATVWLRFGDRLLTPPAPPAVAGVARSAIFDLAPRAGLRAEENALTEDDLARADEVFLSNALAGPVEVRGREGSAASVLGELLWAEERPARRP